MAAQAQVTTFDGVEREERRRIRRTPRDDLGLRLHRAISWGRRAMKELAEPADYGSAVIFLWVAFHAAYGRIRPRDAQAPERERLSEYFEQVLRLDTADRIYSALWSSFSGAIRVLLKNQFVFRDFWEHHNGQGYDNWQYRFDRENEQAFSALAARDTQEVLSTLFDRLYVLRNQLIHGGATWNGSVNRKQVRDGARIMAMLVPHFLMVMLQNPDADWGKPEYPVVG